MRFGIDKFVHKWNIIVSFMNLLSTEDAGMRPILIIAPHAKVYEIAEQAGKDNARVQVDYALLEELKKVRIPFFNNNR